MAKVAIVGAGHSGLELGFSLLQDGDEVIIYSDKRPEDFAATRLPSSNGVFSRGLDRERALGINFWDGVGPLMDKTFVRVGAGDGTVALSVDGRLARHGQAVDQRVKFATWLSEFEKRGGEVVYESIDLARLDEISAAADLTIVAAGKGDITRQFEVDQARMTYPGPQRRILMLSVLDVPHPAPDGVAYNILPGVGEAFGIPMLMANGDAITWVIEAIPGGPMDRFAEINDSDAALAVAQGIFQDFFPWESDRHANARIADANAWLVGGVPPIVRKPVLTLPSGRQAMGIADVVVLNDPCTGQGANSASEAASIVHAAIRERDAAGGAFDEAWMVNTFERFWEYAQWPTLFTNTMMAPWPQHAVQLLAEATVTPEIGHRFTMAFNDPRDLPNFFFDADKALAYVDEAKARAAQRDRVQEEFTAGLAV